MNTIYRYLALSVVLALAGCERNQPVDMPPPQTLTREASGYYCLMTVIAHSGPKGQIHLTGRDQALWFTSVLETLAFTQSPEEPKNIAAIYVNDMSDADWDNPGVDNWIDARQAWYVLGSGRTGGMGAPEAVPFASRENAESYAREQDGRVYDYASIPASVFTSPPE